MEGMLMELSPEMESPGTQELLTQLCQQTDWLRTELVRLQRENYELRQQAGYWKGVHAKAVERLAALQQEVEHLRGDNCKLQDRVFGRKSEKQAAKTDRSNDLEDPNKPSAKRPRGQQRGQPGPKRRDHSHLPARETFVDLPEQERVCQGCGQPFAEMSDTEDSEQLEIEVLVYRRVFRRRRYRPTCRCAGTWRVFTAPAVPKLIPKGCLGISLWVEILLDKFMSYRPTYRLLEQWRTLRLDLALGTVTDGLQRLEPMFTPIYEALIERGRQSVYQQADETRWMVFIVREDKSNHRWWLWFHLSEDAGVYRLDPSRSRRVPEEHYPNDGDTIYLMVDRFSSYKAMAQVKDGVIVLVFCWAHVRRDFVEVGKGWEELKDWALQWLQRIRDLYRLNRERLALRERLNCERLAAPERLALPAPEPEYTAADTALRAAVQDMQTQANAELADPQLREPCRKVLTSLQEHWQGLTRFVEDPRIPMDNNASERGLRGPALGRKNFYGSAAEWSGRLAAMLFSIFATLKMWNLNPRSWLQAYLEKCAQAGGKAPEDIRPFLPWNLSPEVRTKRVEQVNHSNTS
jgi:transposase